MQTKTLTVPATLDSLAEIAAFVLAAADDAGLGRQSRYRLRLAVNELATNTIVYGFPDRPAAATAAGSAPPTIDVRAESADDTLTVILEDAGVPFDLRQVPAPQDLDLPAEERQVGGLGVYLVLGGVNRFAFERVGDRNRNILVMNRPARSG